MPEERPYSSWKQRLDALPVEPSQVVAGVVAVLVLVVAGVGWLISSRQGPSGPPVEEALPFAGSSTSTTVPEAAQVVVHVAGAVARPGVYSLPPRSRVGDAVAAAGGAGPDADLDRVNLAALVADGERVYVPRRGEPAPAPETPVPSARAGPTASGPLDLNTATVEQLESLPGIGPTTARAIVDHRARRGRFRSVEQLLDIRGIGPSKLAALRSKVRV